MLDTLACLGLTAFVLWLFARHLNTRIDQMGTALDALTQAVNDEIALETQAIALLDEIPAEIAAAQSSSNPDSALQALTAKIQAASANLKAAASASGEELAVASPLTPCTLSVAYSAPLSVTGGVAPYSVTNVVGLPAGLSCDPTGLVSGTPTDTPGTFTVSGTVADSGAPPQSAAFSATLVLNPAPTS